MLKRTSFTEDSMQPCIKKSIKLLIGYVWGHSFLTWIFLKDVLATFLDSDHVRILAVYGGSESARISSKTSSFVF